MKQYMVSVHSVAGDEAPAADVIQQMYADVEAFNEEVRAAGAWVFAGGLTEVADATVVREANGSVLTTDGPFAESKEHLGGFWVIKTVDLDEALRWAGKATRACRAPVEVRPFQDDAEE